MYWVVCEESEGIQSSERRGAQKTSRGLRTGGGFARSI